MCPLLQRHDSHALGVNVCLLEGESLIDLLFWMTVRTRSLLRKEVAKKKWAEEALFIAISALSCYNKQADLSKLGNRLGSTKRKVRAP